MLSFYKPSNRDIQKGSALQITKLDTGLGIQLAKQKTLGDKYSKATFDWEFNSFTVAIKHSEIAKILEYIEMVKNEVNNKKVIRELTNNPQLQLNPDLLKEIRLPHLTSKSPKTISIQLNEYPQGSGDLSLSIRIYGVMSHWSRTTNSWEYKKDQSASIYLKKEELEEFVAVLQNTLENQLNSKDNITVDIALSNIPTNKGFEMPNGTVELHKNLNVHKAISNNDIIKINNKNGFMAKVLFKHYDSKDNKLTLICEKL
jgi:hypothetical protein